MSLISRSSYIVFLVWSMNEGGAEFALTQIIPALEEQRVSVRLISLVTGDGRATQRLRDAGIPVTQLANSKFDLLRKLPGLWFLLRREKPHQIWTSLPGATLIGQIMGKTLGIPVISWQHNAFLSPRNAALFRIFHNLTHTWIADSDAAHAYLVDEMSVPKERVETWPLFFLSPRYRQTSKLTPRPHIRIGTIGKLEHQKGYDFLLKVAAKLRDEYPELNNTVSFVIAGDGSLREELTQTAKSLSLDNILFEGFQEDIATWLGTIDIYFQPSRWEGLCIASLEAMAAGRPVVASKVGALASNVIHGKTGFIVPPGDVTGYVNALHALLIDESKRIAMGSAGQEFVYSRFSESHFKAAARRIISKFDTTSAQ